MTGIIETDELGQSAIDPTRGRTTVRDLIGDVPLRVLLEDDGTVIYLIGDVEVTRTLGSSVDVRNAIVSTRDRIGQIVVIAEGPEATFSELGLGIRIDDALVAHVDADREAFYPLEVARMLMVAVSNTLDVLAKR